MQHLGNFLKLCNEMSIVKYPDVCDKPLTIYSLYSPPAGAVRVRAGAVRDPCGRRAAHCGQLASAVVFVKNLRQPHGCLKATVRHHFKGRTAAAGFLSP